jgi:hypothetical protein
LKTWLPKFFKEITKNVESQKKTLRISRFRRLGYRDNEKGHVKESSFIDGLIETSD